MGLALAGAHPGDINYLNELTWFSRGRSWSAAGHFGIAIASDAWEDRWRDSQEPRWKKSFSCFVCHLCHFSRWRRPLLIRRVPVKKAAYPTVRVGNLFVMMVQSASRKKCAVRPKRLENVRLFFITLVALVVFVGVISYLSGSSPFPWGWVRVDVFPMVCGWRIGCRYGKQLSQPGSYRCLRSGRCAAYCQCNGDTDVLRTFGRGGAVIAARNRWEDEILSVNLITEIM